MPINDRTHFVAEQGYRRRERPVDPSSLSLWVEEQLDELQRLSEFVEDVAQVADTPPENPRIGVRRYAVAPWDPGEGFNRWYTFDGISWVPDGSSVAPGPSAEVFSDPDFTFVNEVLTQITYASGQVRSFIYDLDGQLVSIVTNRPPNGPTDTRTFTYNPDGTLASIR